MTTKILLSVPTRGQINVYLAMRLEQILRANPDLPPILYRTGHLAVDSVRNDIVAEFLKTDADALLMIDDDIVPPMEVLRLAEVPADIAAIPYPMFRGGNFPVPCVFYRTEGNKVGIVDPPWGQTGLLGVDAIGTGCMLIHRRVLEHPELHPAFMLVVNADGICTSSEDVAFCLRARDLGFSVVADYRFGVAEHLPNGVGLLDVHTSYLRGFQRGRRQHVGASA